ncbi:UPF0515 protein [Biomphalaria pfeifferi]|uniref:UPF0515 protein n=1 Tax=Biomphalaria pfeifferi TaxID=112525 RepID=A0AAD8BED9_BIOPF|nr:UPF0515 protein [Biomphalaria pfeifferi]
MKRLDCITMEHNSLENEARRLRELFKGRFNQQDAILLVTHHGENAANYVLQESPENVAKFLEEDRTVRFSEEEVARVNRLLKEGLESESKPRLFACGKCTKCWWKRVPFRKQVSRCFKCNTKYDPVPEEDEWGLGEFECHFCGYFFRSTAIMNITECVCHRCNHTVKVSRITPPSKKPRQVPNRQYHHCNGENCYDRLTLPSKCDRCANKETQDVPHNDAVVRSEADTCKCSRRHDRRGGLQRPFNDNELVHILASDPQGPGHEKQPYQDGNFVGMKLPKKELKNRQMQLNSHEIGLKLQQVTLEELHIDRGKREVCREKQGMNRNEKLACQIQPVGELKEKLVSQIKPEAEMKEKLVSQIQPAGEMKEKLVSQIKPKGEMKEKLVSQIQLKGKRLLHKDELENDEQAMKPKEDVVERPLCYHPLSVPYLPQKAVVRTFSEKHTISASTVTTCLDQSSLKTEPFRVAYTLYSEKKKHKH